MPPQNWRVLKQWIFIWPLILQITLLCGGPNWKIHLKPWWISVEADSDICDQLPVRKTLISCREQHLTFPQHGLSYSCSNFSHRVSGLQCKQKSKLQKCKCFSNLFLCLLTSFSQSKGICTSQLKRDDPSTLWKDLQCNNLQE